MKNNKRMKLKNNKSKKYILRKLFYLLIIYLTFSYTYYYSIKNANYISNEEFINFLLSTGNHNIINNNKLNNIVNSTMNYFLHIDFTNPSSLLNIGLSNSKTITLEYNDDYSNLEELKKISSYINDPNPTDINNPIVYIYNSHQLENYSNELLEIYGITPNVLMASYLLKERLLDYGISTIVEDTNMSDFLTINGWNYNNSYQASRILMLDKKNKYNSLIYYVDIHRDSVSKSISSICINDKNYAKVLFVIGLENPNYEYNLDLSNKLNNIINSNYPGLSRGILKKEGANVDGIYNQDVSSNAILIEVGAVENNIEEVLNTIDALSYSFSILIGDNDE